MIVVALIMAALFCACDIFHRVIIVRNESNNNIIAGYSFDSTYTDRELFYGDKSSIKKHTSSEILDPSLPKNVFFIFIFHEDSVYANISAKEETGIVKRTLLKKLEIINTRTRKTDTLVFR